jgi:GDP-L-fucose synthase
VSAYWRDKQALVTGAGGFIGAHLQAQLRAAGCLNIFAARHQDYDLTQEAAVEQMFRTAAAIRPAGAQLVVFHLAGLTGGIGAHMARPAEMYHQNILINTHTLHHAYQAGAVQLVATGAGNGYPVSAPNPLQEVNLWDGYPQPETAPYGLAKRMLQTQSQAYWQQYHFPSVVALLANLYGPHDRFDLAQPPVIAALVARFVNAVATGQPTVTVWGTGVATRDLVYVGDVAAAMLRAAEVYRDAQVINLASGTNTSIRQIVELLTRLTGFQGEVVWDTSKPDGQSARRFDISKAQRDLGWQPHTGLEDGLRQTIAWYRAHFNQPTATHV